MKKLRTSVVSEEICLTMNSEKTKVMTTDEQEFRLDDNEIEKVDSYTYISGSN